MLVAVLLLAPLASGSISIAPAGFRIEVAFAGDGFQGLDAQDGVIYATIVKRLSQDPVMRGNTIVVNVTNGVVLLSGQVLSKKAQKRAAKLCGGIKDVKVVKNQTTVQKR
jgi:osmotically-inducible protein OsmY